MTAKTICSRFVFLLIFLDDFENKGAKVLTFFSISLIINKLFCSAVAFI